MRILKVLLFANIMVTSSFVSAADKNSVPESCVKLVSALEACDKGPEGPFGTVRKHCKKSAKKEYKCALPIKEVRKLIKK